MCDHSCCRWKLALRIALALSLLAALYGRFGAAPSFAQSPSFEGSYALVAEQSDDIAGAIEAGVAKMNFIKRPIARGRLMKTNPAYQAIAITRTEAGVSVTLDGRAPIVSPASGEAVRWKREDGELFDVRSDWQGGVLRQTFAARDGQRENLFTLDPDGHTLRLRVTITSGQLPVPIVYTLVYRRE